jgi:hypothetical protein
LADRPAFFAALAPRLEELRARTGRPHWIAVDEATPAAGRGAPVDARHAGLLLVTVHPEHVAPALLAEVGTVVAVGAAPADTLAAFAAAVGAPRRRSTPTWRPARWWSGRVPRARRRCACARASRAPSAGGHVRKYAAGELGPDRSFYFRGPDGRLNLRATETCRSSAVATA